MVRQYIYNWLVLTSQFFSVLLGGHPDESLSQRTARAYLAKPSGWFKYQLKFIDFVMLKLTGEKNHCLASIEGEKNTKTIWQWDK